MRVYQSSHSRFLSLIPRYPVDGFKPIQDPPVVDHDKARDLFRCLDRLLPVVSFLDDKSSQQDAWCQRGLFLVSSRIQKLSKFFASLLIYVPDSIIVLFVLGRYLFAHFWVFQFAMETFSLYMYSGFNLCLIFKEFSNNFSEQCCLKCSEEDYLWIRFLFTSEYFQTHCS